VVAARARLAVDAVARVKGLRSDQRAWTAEEDATLARMTADGATKTEIGRVLDRTPEAVANRRWKTGVRSPLTGKPKGYELRPVAEYTPPPSDGNVGLRYAAAVLAPEATREETAEEFLARMFQNGGRSVQKAKAQRHATVKIASDKPVGLAFLGDQHIDTKGTDLAFLRQTAEYIARMEGLYGILLGDLLQNNIVHRDKDVRSVADQLRFADIYIEWMRGKLLGGVTGNHDDWALSLGGFDHIKAMATRHKFHAVPDELTWKVQIVNPHDADEVTAEWVIATRHQFRRHSNLNPLHACWRWLEEQVANWERVPDVLVLAHNHSAAVGVHNYAGKDVWGVRMGSAQLDSAYARQKGFQDFRPTAPVAVLPPNQAGRVVCFSDADQAVQHMRGWRDVAA
jgi:hypothetical protein